MGKKYLLEIEENKDGSFAWSNFAPYVKPDLEQVRKEAYEQGRKDGKIEGQAETWVCVKKIALHPEEGGIALGDIRKIFGCSHFQTVFRDYSASEAIEKIRQYEQEKKEKEEQIQVGDEVNAQFGKAIVVNVDSVAEKIWVLYADGHGGFDFFKNAPTKTGRHFPEIAEALRKMRE